MPATRCDDGLRSASGAASGQQRRGSDRLRRRRRAAAGPAPARPARRAPCQTSEACALAGDKPTPLRRAKSLAEASLALARACAGLEEIGSVCFPQSENIDPLPVMYPRGPPDPALPVVYPSDLSRYSPRSDRIFPGGHLNPILARKMQDFRIFVLPNSFVNFDQVYLKAC